MPARSPFLIVQEYLNPSEQVQVRKNAVTALAALDDEESSACLAERAVTDPEVEVRKWAKDEITNLPPESSQRVLSLVLRDLSDSQRQRTAYLLLGELHNKGLRFTFPPISIFDRFRLAKAMRDHVYPKRGARFWFRTPLGMLLGTLGAVIGVFLFYLGLKVIPDMGIAFMYWIIGFLMTIAIGLLGTVMSSPASLYPDWIGGALLDMVTAAVVATIAAAISVIPFAIKYPDTHPYWLLLFAPLAAVAVRAGTLAVFGLVKSLWLNRIFQTITGGTCGLAVYELLILATKKNSIWFYAGAGVWIILISYGLAAAFAWVDSGSRPRAIVPRFVSGFAVLVVLLCLAFNLVELLPPRAAPATPTAAAVQEINLGPITDAAKTIAIGHLPVTFLFSVEKDVVLYAKFQDLEGGYLHLSTKARRPSQSDQSEQHPYVVERLTPNVQYMLIATPTPEIQQADLLPNDIVSGMVRVVERTSWARFKTKIRRVPTPPEALSNIKIDLDFKYY